MSSLSAYLRVRVKLKVAVLIHNCGIIKPYEEDSCVSDPCWYDVPGATGKEVIILDLYPGTSENIAAKHITDALVASRYVRPESTFHGC